MISSINHLLIPTDFSDSSKNALRHAASIAIRQNAHITLLHVIDPPFNFPKNIDGVIGYLKKNAEQHLDHMVSEINNEYTDAGFSISTRIRVGKPISEIIESVSDEQADLIVIGSGMDNPARKVLFGSVSTDVILRSPVPVLTVPSNITSVEVHRILFTTDFRDGDLHNLRELSHFASLFNASIDILHVSEKHNLETEAKFRGLQALVREKNIYDNIRFELITDTDPFTGISDYVREHDISMLVMNRYKKSIVGLLMDKNYAKKFGVYTMVPLLVLLGEHQSVPEEPV